MIVQPVVEPMEHYTALLMRQFVAVFRDTKKSHNAQLRAACEAALKEIQEMVGSDTASEGDNVSISSVLPDLHDAAKLDADKYFLPFRYFVQIFLVQT